MKKQFPTYLDAAAAQYDRISLSAGIRGQQILVAPQAIIDLLHAVVCPLTTHPAPKGR